MLSWHLRAVRPALSTYKLWAMLSWPEGPTHLSDARNTRIEGKHRTEVTETTEGEIRRRLERNGSRGHHCFGARRTSKGQHRTEATEGEIRRRLERNGSRGTPLLRCEKDVKGKHRTEVADGEISTEAESEGWPGDWRVPVPPELLAPEQSLPGSPFPSNPLCKTGGIFCD
jgi:hypothetical protein